MYHVTPDELVRRTEKDKRGVACYGKGFKKINISNTALFGRLRAQFERNAERFVPEFDESSANPEEYLLTVERRKPASLLCVDQRFNDELHAALKKMHEDWCGMRLVPTSSYGMRKYLPGSFLYNHVDMIETHVISSTICVDSCVDEPWPLYIEDVNGEPHEVTMETGDLVFYESAFLVHGRPYDLVGKHYVGHFVHYRPVGVHFEAARD